MTPHRQYVEQATADDDRSPMVKDSSRRTSAARGCGSQAGISRLLVLQVVHHRLQDFVDLTFGAINPIFCSRSTACSQLGRSHNRSLSSVRHLVLNTLIVHRLRASTKSG